MKDRGLGNSGDIIRKKLIKVRITRGYEEEFERYCKENNIWIQAYPRPVENVYSVDANSDDLLPMYRVIDDISDMPEVALDLI